MNKLIFVLGSVVTGMVLGVFSLVGSLNLPATVDAYQPATFAVSVPTGATALYPMSWLLQPEEPNGYRLQPVPTNGEQVQPASQERDYGKCGGQDELLQPTVCQE